MSKSTVENPHRLLPSDAGHHHFANPSALRQAAIFLYSMETRVFINDAETRLADESLRTTLHTF
ncbi:hypothetical protein AB7828_04800 [Tardiphaga sp. 215_C5_N2_1]|uniref:hypothetical protein n=1 Tax=Tardiphaga sp. 215_C5_N2_1 TaxID=3240774 RepID=UPI003F88F484